MKERTPSFIQDYDGLQIQYYGAEELILVPRNITDLISETNNNIEIEFPAYWTVDDLGIEVIEVYYNVKVHINNHCIYNHYDEDKNQQLVSIRNKYDFDIDWGIETISCNDGIWAVTWKSDLNNKIYSLPGKTGNVHYGLINIESRKKRSVEMICRDQSIFRQRLITLDKQCALTECDIHNALDAAHIIPVKKGGRELINNGILLRKDIHALFDKDLILINDKGIVSLKSNNRERYWTNYEYLNGLELNEKIYKRIEKSLKERNNSKN